MKELILKQIENAISSLQIEEAYRLAESIDLCLDERLSNHFNLDWFKQYLILSGNIKEQLIKLTNLKTLYLDDNRIKEIPKEIGYLTNLIILDLSNNNLTKLPTEIGNLTNLISLRLDNNKLKELPKEIGYLTKLSELYLSYNNLKELPTEIGNLINLKYLDLYTNVIPTEIQELIKRNNL